VSADRRALREWLYPAAVRRLLAPWEIALLACGLLVLVPGACAVASWPFLWVAAGYFFARKVLGARGFLLVVHTLLFGVALGAMLAVASSVVAGAPKRGVLVVVTWAFALGCAAYRTRAPKGRGADLPPVPWPPALVLFVVAAWLALQIPHAMAESARLPRTSDGWYLHGVVRELAASFPPRNPVAATTTLMQPWGYWMLYAATHVASGATIGTTLQVASIVLALAFLAVLHALVSTITGRAQAGGMAVVVALGASDLGWLDAAAEARWARDGVLSFGGNLAYAFYDVPALLLAAGVVYFVVVGRSTRGVSPWACAATLLAVLPLMHVVYAFVLAVALAALLALDAAVRRSVRGYGLLALAPVPFLVFYVGLYARGHVGVRAPFDLRLDGWTDRLAGYVKYTGMLLPAAALGVVTRTLRARTPLVTLLGAAALLAIFAVSFADNYHWAFDAHGVALAALAGLGLDAASRRGPIGRVAALALASAVLASGGHAARLGDDLRALADGGPARPVGEEELVAWIRASTPREAIFAVDEGSARSIVPVLALGGRALYLGPPYLLSTTMPSADVERLADDNHRALSGPCMAPSAAAARVDYVVLERERHAALLGAWAATAPVLAGPEILVFDSRAARARCAPASAMP